MQSKLDQNQIEAVSERFHDHPLLRTCQMTFARYEGDMEKLLFAPEEIFQESAIVLDRLLTDAAEAPMYIERLWDSLKVKIRRWDKDATQGDLNKITGAICFVVAATLCQHIHSFYNERMKDLLLDAIHRNMGIDEAEETRIIQSLSKCAEDLNDWLLDYVESEEMLSEEIEESLLHPNMAMKISRQKPTDTISFATVVIKKVLVEEVVSQLHELMKGKTKPKDLLMPIRAAMDVGVIRRPTWEEFCREFGNECVKNKSSFSNYTNPDKTCFEDANYEALKSQFRSLIRN